MSISDKPALTRRLNRIAGQVQGIGRMIEGDRYCIDILHQIQAIKSALDRVEDAILNDHAASCLETAIRSGDAENQRRKFAELVDLIGRVKR